MVLIQDRILKIDIYNFEMSYKTPEKSLKSNQIYSVAASAAAAAGCSLLQATICWFAGTDPDCACCST